MGERTVEQAASFMVEQSARMYPSHEELVAMRCALGDAAGLCDSMHNQIKREWRGRGGITKKQGVELAAVAKRCGDAIWAMRDLIDPNSPGGKA